MLIEAVPTLKMALARALLLNFILISSSHSLWAEAPSQRMVRPVKSSCAPKLWIAGAVLISAYVAVTTSIARKRYNHDPDTQLGMLLTVSAQTKNSKQSNPQDVEVENLIDGLIQVTSQTYNVDRQFIIDSVDSNDRWESTTVSFDREKMLQREQLVDKLLTLVKTRPIDEKEKDLVNLFLRRLIQFEETLRKFGRVDSPINVSDELRYYRPKVYAEILETLNTPAP